MCKTERLLSAVRVPLDAAVDGVEVDFVIPPDGTVVHQTATLDQTGILAASLPAARPLWLHLLALLAQSLVRLARGRERALEFSMTSSRALGGDMGLLAVRRPADLGAYRRLARWSGACP